MNQNVRSALIRLAAAQPAGSAHRRVHARMLSANTADKAMDRIDRAANEALRGVIPLMPGGRIPEHGRWYFDEDEPEWASRVRWEHSEELSLMVVQEPGGYSIRASFNYLQQGRNALKEANNLLARLVNLSRLSEDAVVTILTKHFVGAVDKAIQHAESEEGILNKVYARLKFDADKFSADLNRSIGKLGLFSSIQITHAVDPRHSYRSSDTDVPYILGHVQIRTSSGHSIEDTLALIPKVRNAARALLPKYTGLELSRAPAGVERFGNDRVVSFQFRFKS